MSGEKAQCFSWENFSAHYCDLGINPPSASIVLVLRRKKCSDRVSDQPHPIHNAAVFDITQKKAVRTDEGIETVWATNHQGPVLLTACLWEALQNSAQARILTIASKGLIANPFLKVDLNDPIQAEAL